MTDGAVNNTDRVVDCIWHNSRGKLRLHTFGVGNGVSTDLVKRCATVGNG